jgi:hypothetical protein
MFAVPRLSWNAAKKRGYLEDTGFTLQLTWLSSTVLFDRNAVSATTHPVTHRASSSPSSNAVGWSVTQTRSAHRLRHPDVCGAGSALRLVAAATNRRALCRVRFGARISSQAPTSRSVTTSRRRGGRCIQRTLAFANIAFTIESHAYSAVTLRAGESRRARSSQGCGDHSKNPREEEPPKPPGKVASLALQARPSPRHFASEELLNAE